MKYDAIVIGGGGGGLVSSLALQKKGKNVLLLDKGHLPFGKQSAFCRGRFSFDCYFQELWEIGSKDNLGYLGKIFKDLDVLDDIKMQSMDEVFNVVSLDDNESFSFPTGVDNFILKMEEYVPNSRRSMEEFFSLCKEVSEAIVHLDDVNLLKEKYGRFIKVSDLSLLAVLKKLHMPSKAISLLGTYWFYLHSPIDKISFVEYALVIYGYVNSKPFVPLLGMYDVSLTLFEKFTSLGGSFKLFTEVSEILTENNKIIGVKTLDGKKYLTDNVICDLSPNLVYGKLINSSCVPSKAKSLTNSRILGPRMVCVYLGLNKSASQLGLKHASYFIYHTLNSKKEFERMKRLKNDNLVANVLNVVNDEASDKGTCVICLQSLIFSNVFSKTVTMDNYFDLKEAFADNMISVFEQATSCDIRSCIEEIEIATPLTFCRYTNNADGSMGYMTSKCDNLLPRLMNRKNENYIDGLYFTGDYSAMTAFTSWNYLSGYDAYLSIMEKEDNDER